MSRPRVPARQPARRAPSPRAPADKPPRARPQRTAPPSNAGPGFSLATRISSPGDPLEREADAAAAAATGVQVAHGAGSGEPSGAPGPPGLDGVLSGLRGTGVPLPEDARADFENRMQADFSAVRLHMGPAAAAAAQAVDAAAFAHREHIVFAPGRFDPASPGGRRLLSHELAHTVQQGASRPRGPGAPKGRARGSLVQRDPPPGSGGPTPSGSDIQEEWYVPAAADEAGLLEEGRTLLALHRQVNGAAGSDGTADYWIVTNRLYIYSNAGSRLGSVGVRGGRMMAPGIYASLAGRNWDRAGRQVIGGRADPWSFYPYFFTSRQAADAQHPSQWLEEGGHARAIALSSADPDTVLVIAPYDEAPAPPPVDLGAAARETVRQVRARIAASAGRRPRAPGQTHDDTPDSVQARSGPNGTTIAVTADGATTEIPYFEGETPAEAEERVRGAAEGLRRARDPASSVALRSGATTTGVTGAPAAHEARVGPGSPGGDVDVDSLEGSSRTANAPGYPASIRYYEGGGSGGQQVAVRVAREHRNVGRRSIDAPGAAPAARGNVATPGSGEAMANTTVTGATGHFTMELDYDLAGRDTLSQVTARMQHIRYRWELIDVGGLTDDQIDRSRLARAGSGEAHGPGSGLAADWSREMDAIAEDTAADVRDALAPGLLPWEARAAYLAIVGVSNDVRVLGQVISSFISLVSQPLNERAIGFDREGEFLVRCVATPVPSDRVPEDQRVIRASSVAVLPIKVVNINRRAAQAADETQNRIAELMRLLDHPPEGWTVERLREEIDRLRAAEWASPLASANEQIRRFESQLTYLTRLRDYEAAGTPLERRDPEVRLFAAMLELNGLNRETAREQVERTLGQLRPMRDRMTGYGARDATGAVVYPRVVLASEETGQVIQMMTTLHPMASRNGRIRWRLADITSPRTQDEYVGESSRSGHAGNVEAIRNAFVRFREQNGYGRGTIAIRLPPDLATPAGGPVVIDDAMRSAPGTRGRVMQRLQDLATAAEVAGLVVTGPVGLLIGAVGGVAGAIVAIEHLARRERGDRLELDFETFTDILGVLGGFTAVGGLGAHFVGRAAGQGTALARRARLVGQTVHVAGAGMLAGQVILIPVSLARELAAIDAEEHGPNPPSPGQLAARRAEAIARAMRSGFVTVVSIRQMIEPQPVEPPAEGAAGPRPAETPAAPPDGPPPPAGADPPGGGARVDPPSGLPHADVPPPRGGPPEAPAAATPAPPRRPRPGTIQAPSNPQPISRAQWTHAVARTIGVVDGAPLVGRIKIVSPELVGLLWSRVHPNRPLPDGTIAIHDPAAGHLYVQRSAFTSDMHASLVAQLRRSMNRRVVAALGQGVAEAFFDRFTFAAIEGSPFAEVPSRGPLELVTRLERTVGIDVLSRAFFSGELGTLHSAMTERLGPARANAVLHALRAGTAELPTAMRLLEGPRPEFRDAFGSLLAGAVEDATSARLNPDARPQNAARTALGTEIAATVGRDVLEAAYFDGQVGPLRDALQRAFGASRSEALIRALLDGDLPAAQQAVRPGPLPATPPRVGEPAAGEPAAGATDAPQPAPARPEPHPLGPRGRALEQALRGADSDAAGRAALEAMIEVRDFRLLREMVDAGAFGSPLRAAEVIQQARQQVIDAVLDRVEAMLRDRYPGLQIRRSDHGTPGFRSDRDVTVKAEGGQGADVNEMVTASVEGVQRAYELLDAMGLPPDAALDANFYTELHEASFAPASATERGQIVADQSVVSMAEMRMSMDAAQWDAYRSEQLRAVGGEAPRAGLQGEIEASARARVTEQLARAEELAGRLTTNRVANLAAARARVLEAMRRPQPPSAREIRMLMAEVKLLEAGAYGTRAAVEDVVDFQQRLARNESAADVRAALQRPGRIAGSGLARAEALAGLAQTASASLAHLAGAHPAPPAPNNPTHALAVAKFLGRIWHSFREAGLSVSDPLVDQTNSIVASKQETPAATMRELRTWADSRADLRPMTDQQVLDAFVQHSEALARQLVTRLRAAETTAQAQAEMFEGPAGPPPAPPQPPPPAAAPAAPPPRREGPPAQATDTPRQPAQPHHAADATAPARATDAPPEPAPPGPAPSVPAAGAQPGTAGQRADGPAGGRAEGVDLALWRDVAGASEHAVPELRRLAERVRQAPPTGRDVVLRQEMETVRATLMASDSDVGRVATSLRRAGQPVDRATIARVKSYLFDSPGIVFDLTNYLAWKRLSSGRATIFDVRFMVHEIAEQAAFRQRGFDPNPGDWQAMTPAQRAAWQQRFNQQYLAAHSVAVGAEYSWLAGEITRRTGGRVRLAPEVVAACDPNWNQGRSFFRPDGPDGPVLEDHPRYAEWRQPRWERIDLPAATKRRLGLEPRATPTISQVIAAVKRSVVDPSAGPLSPEWTAATPALQVDR